MYVVVGWFNMRYLCLHSVSLYDAFYDRAQWQYVKSYLCGLHYDLYVSDSVTNVWQDDIFHFLRCRSQLKHMYPDLDIDSIKNSIKKYKGKSWIEPITKYSKYDISIAQN